MQMQKLVPAAAATIEAATQSAIRLINPPKFILGSRSSSRRSLLEATGATFDIQCADIDEKALGDRSSDRPTDLVRHLAVAKADALLSRFQSSSGGSGGASAAATAGEAAGAPAGGRILLTGDQVVAFEGAIREKPQSRDEARAFLESYARGPCSTVGAICLHDMASGCRVVGLHVAEIHLDPLPTESIDAMVNDDYVLGCAGALMIEHPMMAPHVRRIDGGVDSVLGLGTGVLAHLVDELRYCQQQQQQQQQQEVAGLVAATRLDEASDHILRQRTWAVVGDVLNPDKFASKIVRRLEDCGRTVHLVNPRDDTGRCHKNITGAAAAAAGKGEEQEQEAKNAQQGGGAAGAASAASGGGEQRPRLANIDAINLVISPRVGTDFVEEMWRLGIRYLFVQPGADAPHVLARARELGLVVKQSCVLREEFPPMVSVPAPDPVPRASTL